MISVIIHCNEDIDPLADTLAMLVSGAVFGLINEVILWSDDHSNVLKTIADDTGCHYLPHSHLGAAIASAKSNWLLFLSPGSRLLDQWREILSRYVKIETKPASFRPVRDKKFWPPSAFFSRHHFADNGLLIRTQQINKTDLRNEKDLVNLRNIRPVILPIQIITKNMR